MSWILFLNRRTDRRGVILHKGCATHSGGKSATSLRDMMKIAQLCVAKPRWRTTPPSVLLLNLYNFHPYHAPKLTLNRP
ncbi:hypothetical protein DK867_12245 [Ochrobactrum sp. POC9]|nr:hypothetical protein DK867_12245 [Ochrobactrum sp. POC9]